MSQLLHAGSVEAHETVPVISVVIPLYNKEKYIARALGSVLAQTFTDYEVIVVDDGSTDMGAETVRSVARECRAISLVSQENAGPSSARNRGIREAKGEFIALLDADDKWHPDFLAETFRLARAYPDAGMVAANYTVVSPSGSRDMAVDKNILPRVFLEGIVDEPFELWKKASFLFTSSLLLRKSALDRVGLFCENIRTGEDLHLWVRLALRYPVVFVSRSLATYYSELQGSITRGWFYEKEPPPFIFSREFFHPPGPDEIAPGLLESFLDFRAHALRRYLSYWAAAGRWGHARAVARCERVGLVSSLLETGILLDPFFYKGNLKRLLLNLRILRRE